MQRHFTILHAFYISALFVFTFPAYPVKCREQKNQVKIEVRKEHFLLKKIITILCAVVMALSLFAGCGQKADDNNTAAAGGTVSTDGSTSMEKVIGALGESFMEASKGTTFTYNPTGSGSGIQAVSEGRCDIGLSSRALKDDEKASGLTETTLALDGIAIIVNPQNPVQDLTLEQIAKIYTGEITNWKDVGGSDAEIVLIGREAGSGTRDGFESITGTKDACKYQNELTSTGEVIAAVASNPNAIGYYMIPADDAQLSWTFKATTLSGNEYTRTNTLTVAPTTRYDLTFGYEDSGESYDDGGSTLTLDINTEPLETSTVEVPVYSCLLYTSPSPRDS